MIDEIRKDAEQRMQKCVAAFGQALRKLRTGRASPTLLEHLQVEYYGTNVPLSQVSNVAVEDARTLAVTPWEKGMVAVIEKAIINSNLGLTPRSAGTVIRVPLPPLTEERRRDLAKLVRQEAEQGRVSVRNVRRDALNDLREALKEKMINEDQERQAHQQVQDLTDRFVAEIERLSDEKQKEIMEF
ncbi:MAG: ribosome recycling factor [Chromatiales bacterium]|nr:ribosome recycling factor [Chromatiales bacterium]